MARVAKEAALINLSEFFLLKLKIACPIYTPASIY